jgi:Leucine-rich repeat (LRR) protein
MFCLDENLLHYWQNSFKVIQMANEDHLALIERATFFFNFETIKPDAQFLFRKTVDLEMNIAFPNVAISDRNAARSINTSTDPFAAIHCMPDLRKLALFFDESVKRVDYFSPSLPELKYFTLKCFHSVEFGPIAFDHLVGLEELNIEAYGPKLNKFETGLAPHSLRFIRVKHLKLNSKSVSKILKIDTDGMVESILPLSRLLTLSFISDETVDLSIFFSQMTNLQSLSIGLNDLSQVDRGQLSCLPRLRLLQLFFYDENSTGILNIYMKRCEFVNFENIILF